MRISRNLLEISGKYWSEKCPKYKGKSCLLTGIIQQFMMFFAVFFPAKNRRVFRRFLRNVIRNEDSQALFFEKRAFFEIGAIFE